ncbi:alpha/beta hydrolase, partial [Kibdelosporangium lantanae]
MMYTSYRVNGISNAVTGVVFTPSGKVPRDGWPLISWAHGTVGIADQCAPSTAGRSQRDINYLKEWLAAGYAIAATDYEGLGWTFEHPYENGLSEARSVIDIARAAPQVDPTIGRRWMAVGQSQG